MEFFCQVTRIWFLSHKPPVFIFWKPEVMAGSDLKIKHYTAAEAKFWLVGKETFRKS